MNDDVAKALVKLYSRTWRARYGAECEALLRDLPARPDVVADCVGGALVSRWPEDIRIVVSAVSLVALFVLSSPPLHTARDERVKNAALSVWKRSDESSKSVARRPDCYRAGMPPFARAYCA